MCILSKLLVLVTERLLALAASSAAPLAASGWANVWKTQGGAVRSLSNIYSFEVTLYA